jgi:hypothetical protein
MQRWRLWIALAMAAATALPAAGAPARSKSLAQFDSGYAQCERLYPDMRGRRDEAYASVYRLKLDDTLRGQLDETRKSAPYRSERRRAAQTLVKNAAASDVAQRLELQCQGLKREMAKSAPGGDAKR